MTLHRFRYRDPLTGKWLTARYHATKEEIAARYKDFELVGEPEVRTLANVEPFNPFRNEERR